MFEPANSIDGELAWGLGIGLTDKVLAGDAATFGPSSWVHAKSARFRPPDRREHGLQACVEIAVRLMGTSDAEPLRQATDRGWW